MTPNAVLWIILIVAGIYILTRNRSANPSTRRTLDNMGRLSLVLLVIAAIPIVLVIIWIVVFRPQYFP